MKIKGGGSTGFSWYSITTVNRWNIQTCEGRVEIYHLDREVFTLF